MLERDVETRAVEAASTSEATGPEAAASVWGGWRRAGITAGGLAIAAPFFFEALAVLRSNHVALIRRLPDDAFYYLEIAARLGRGEGFTFDGIHTTNGFHPLWQLLLVPVSWMLGSGNDASIRGVFVIGLLCSLAAVLLFVRLVLANHRPGSCAPWVGSSQPSLPSAAGSTRWRGLGQFPMLVLLRDRASPG